MTAHSLLDVLSAARVELRAEGGRLRYRAPPGALTPTLRVAVAAHRAELLCLIAAEAAGSLPARLATWPEDWRFAFEERAAIVEHLGGVPRDQAERDAERMARADHARLADAPGTPR